MKYRESKPSPPLSRYIKCFWSIEHEAVESAPPEPVLPDGCPEIVFNLADRFRLFNSDGIFAEQPRALFAGQITKRITIGPSGKVSLFGVRFHPAGAYPFVGTPISEFTNQVDGLELAIGNDSFELEDRILSSQTIRERRSVFETFLFERLARCDEYDANLQKAAELIVERNGVVVISNLAAELGWGERMLERRFKKFLGLSPKLFARIRRFSAVLKAIESFGPERSLEFAHDYDYYDQAHMINDFREFAAESPTAFYERSHRLSELFTVGR
ncbi:MAG: DUF6597 domain-containing transcriptional factor [Pyrinomonadaceae bacterium]